MWLSVLCLIGFLWSFHTKRGFHPKNLHSTHLDPEHFYLEVIDHLWPAGCLDILWLCGHADMNGDLEVVLFLADKGLIS